MKHILAKLRSIEFTHAGVAFMVALFYACVVNIPLYKEFYKLYQDGQHVSIGLLMCLPILVFAVLTIVFNLLSWPFTTRPVFITLLLTSSGISYAALNYGMLSSYGMIENVFQTNSSEAGSYINLPIVLWTTFTGILPAILIAIIKIQPGFSIKKKLLSMTICAVIIMAILAVYYENIRTISHNNGYLKKMVIPTYYLNSAYKYIQKNYFAPPIPYKPIGEDAHISKEKPKSKPTLFVFVLGEAARSQNYALNGYPKDTNEYTRQHNVISYQDVSSCGTATAVSVPCMFSSLNRVNYDEKVAKNEDNALDILKRAGIDILWKDNDGGDKGVMRNGHKIMLDNTKENAFCDGSTCHDMGLLQGFDKNVKQMKPGDKLIVLHLVGSHGPTYYLRYPKAFQKFTPVCKRSDIQNCSQESIINAYDNSILYTDYLVSQTIDKLKALHSQYNTALWYMSDHGESLGEGGVNLHGMPYELAPIYQKRVPLILWMSNGFKKAKHIDEQCLREEAKKGGYSQDYLFSSLIGIMDVKTKAYNPKMDLYQPCRS